MKTSPYYALVSFESSLLSTQLRMSNLVAALEKEFVWVNAVLHSISEKGEPVENDRRLIRVFPEKLLEDVEDYG